MCCNLKIIIIIWSVSVVAICSIRPLFVAAAGCRQSLAIILINYKHFATQKHHLTDSQTRNNWSYIVIPSFLILLLRLVLGFFILLNSLLWVLPQERVYLGSLQLLWRILNWLPACVVHCVCLLLSFFLSYRSIFLV